MKIATLRTRAITALLSCIAPGYFAAALPAAAASESAGPVVREEAKVVIDGVEETWRLEWTKPPEPACAPEGDDWYACPCSGFAFGERGDLTLVRKRPGKKDERLSLTQLFNEYAGDYPGMHFDPPQAALRKWDMLESDRDEKAPAGLAARVRARPPAAIMRFGDYDQDGRATEFILQIGTLPCGKRMSVAVGISRKNPRLHAFSSAGNPDMPLVLQDRHWEALRTAAGTVRVVHWPCGDHGYNSQDEYELKTEKGRIHATKLQYGCTQDGKRDELLERKAF